MFVTKQYAAYGNLNVLARARESRAVPVAVEVLPMSNREQMTSAMDPPTLAPSPPMSLSDPLDLEPGTIGPRALTKQDIEKISDEMQKLAADRDTLTRQRLSWSDRNACRRRGRA